MKVRARPILAILLGAAAASLPRAEASIYHLPESLAQDAVSETVPSAFPPSGFEAEDFAAEWTSRPIEGVSLKVVKRSLQWVRIGEIFVLPRGRLEVQAASVESGQVHNGSFTQHFAVSGGSGTVEMPVALVSGKDNRISIVVRRGGQDLRGEAEIRFRPRPTANGDAPRVYTDTTCTPRGIRVESSTLASDQWIYIGCRLAVVEDEHDTVGSLEMYVFWEGAGETIRVGGVETQASTPGVWALRLRNKPGKVTIRSGETAVTLAYFAPDPLDMAALGLGVGPYAYTFQGAGESLSTYVPVLTLYGSYLLTDSSYLVAFSAAALSKQNPNADLGIYLRSESVRTLDQRISINFLFGGHALAFRHLGNLYLKIGLPQGFEAVLRDAVWRGWSMSAGAFLFPPVDDKLYYNLWYRFGRGPYFAEINYIAFQEKISAGLVYSRSVGVTFGFPVAKFW